jgi:hypothetical protein
VLRPSGGRGLHRFLTVCTGCNLRRPYESYVRRFRQPMRGDRVQRRRASVANVAERDHEQVLEAFAYDMVGKIGPVMDQGGNDLSRIG